SGSNNKTLSSQNFVSGFSSGNDRALIREPSLTPDHFNPIAGEGILNDAQLSLHDVFRDRFKFTEGNIVAGRAQVREHAGPGSARQSQSRFLYGFCRDCAGAKRSAPELIALFYDCDPFAQL